MAEKFMMTGKTLAFCTNLATKRSFVSDAPPATYMTEETATTGYWCIRTMGPIGPDDGFVCPGDCGAHRACYEPNIKPPV